VAVDNVVRALGEAKEAIATMGDRVDHSVAKFSETVTNLALQIARRGTSAAGD